LALFITDEQVAFSTLTVPQSNLVSPTDIKLVLDFEAQLRSDFAIKPTLFGPGNQAISTFGLPAQTNLTRETFAIVSGLTQPGINMSSPASGEWKIRLTDSVANFKGGILHGWCLSFRAVGVPDKTETVIQTTTVLSSVTTTATATTTLVSTVTLPGSTATISTTRTLIDLRIQTATVRRTKTLKTGTRTIVKFRTKTRTREVIRVKTC
jgi:hypothetical protein